MVGDLGRISLGGVTSLNDCTCDRTGVSSDGAGGARRGPCCWLARRSPRDNLARDCERRDSQLDGPNAPGWAAREEWAATSVRRVGGEATVWALEAAVNAQYAISMDRVPKLSLRRRRVLLVAARSSPCGAARGNV